MEEAVNRDCQSVLCVCCTFMIPCHSFPPSLTEILTFHHRVYKSACRQYGCVPVAAFQRHMGEREMNLSEHSIGPKVKKKLGKRMGCD